MFDGCVSLVTGGASGIGRAIAERFAEKGAHVVVADIDASGAEMVAKRLRRSGLLAMAIRVDVSNQSSVYAMTAEIERELGRLDHLVNCAGIDQPTRLEDLTEETYDQILGIDLKGVYLVSRASAALLSQSSVGAIVNISSVMAWFTNAGYVAYTAAKAGVLGMTKALAVELGPAVRVNAICPGFIDTPIWQRNLDAMEPSDAEAFAERIRAVHPVGRRGLPADIAAATTFLCSSDAAFISGTQLVVDGGVTTRLASYQASSIRKDNKLTDSETHHA